MFRYKTQGWTDTATWLIIYKENYETLRSALSLMRTEVPTSVVLSESEEDYETLAYFLSLNVSEEPISPYNIEMLERHFNSLQTFFHETMHFWHAIGTHFLYIYTVRYLYALMEVRESVNKSIRGGKRLEDIIPLSEFQPNFIAATNVLLSPSDPVRTIDVIEGCAVFCSYRILESWFSKVAEREVRKPKPRAIMPPNATHEGFLRYLQKKHFVQREYQCAYLFATRVLGDKAFDLFSPICYLALQGVNPGEYFVSIIDRVKKDINSFRGQEEAPLSFLDQFIEDRMEGYYFPSFVRQWGGLSPGFSHPILKPYVEYLAQVSDIKKVEDFFARPYYYVDIYNSDTQITGALFRKLMPPMHVFSDNVVTQMGIGAEQGTDYPMHIYLLTA